MKRYILAILSFFFFFPSLNYAEDCQQAVDLYNQGTASIDPLKKEALFKEASKLCSDPDILSRVYNNLGDTYEKAGKLSRALTYYRKALEVKNDLVTSYISVGDIFYGLGDYYSAFIMYGKGLKYNPDDKDGSKGREKAETAFKRKMVIYFDLNSFDVSDLYFYRLQIVGKVLKEASVKFKVEVTGYTCNLGSRTYNKKLSLRRAESVVRYLTEELGLDKGNISAIGMGKESPLLPNLDEESRMLNRRVEVKILELF